MLNGGLNAWEQVNLKYLSEWKDRVKELVVDRISGLKGKFTLLFIIPRTVLLSSIQPEGETLDFSTHAFPRNL